jgi:hypothetical protein
MNRFDILDIEDAKEREERLLKERREVEKVGVCQECGRKRLSYDWKRDNIFMWYEDKFLCETCHSNEQWDSLKNRVNIVFPRDFSLNSLGYRSFLE